MPGGQGVSPVLSEQLAEDPRFHVSDVVEVLHGVEGLFQVPPGAAPAAAGSGCVIRYQL